MTEATPAPANLDDLANSASVGGWAVACCIAILAWLLYFNTVDHGFTLDDVHVVQNNPVVANSDWWGATRATYWPAEVGASNWRPVASLSWLCDRLFLAAETDMHVESQAWASRHHAVNALLHGLVVLSCFPVARRLLGSIEPAWVACLLFAAHPGHTEVVAPVVGRTDLIAALGAFIMCAAFWRYRDTGRLRWLALAVAAFAVGLGGKESVAPVLLLLPLADVLLYDKPMTRWRQWLDYLPFLFVIGAYLFVRAAVLGEQSFAHQQAEQFSVIQRLAFTARNSWVSVVLLFAPINFHHVMTTVPSDSPFTYPPPAGVMVAIWPLLALPLWFGWLPLIRRFPVGALCWIGVLLPWLPTSGLLPAAAGVSLRFLFISTAFAACGLVAAGLWCIQRMPACRPALIGLVVVAVIAGTTITLNRIPAWANDGAFHSSILEEEPRCYTSTYSYGAWLAIQGDISAARQWFERAIVIAGSTPQSISARLNLAASYEYGPASRQYGEDADLESALRIYEETLAIAENTGEAHLKAAVVCGYLVDRGSTSSTRRRELLAKGLQHYEQALEIRPKYWRRFEWHHYAGRMADELQLHEPMVRHFRVGATVLESQSKRVRSQLGEQAWLAYKQEAIQGLMRALSTNPTSAEEAALRAELRALETR